MGGPGWLKLTQEEWPRSECSSIKENFSEERDSEIVPCLVATNEEMWHLKYFSSYKRVVRLITWILRFRENASTEPKERKNGELPAEEILTAEKRLVRIVQNATLCQKKSSDLKTLCVFEDGKGILHIRTKITLRK